MTPVSAWSRGGLAGIVALVSLVLLGLILHYGPQYGLNTRPKQAMAFMAIWFALLIIRYTSLVFKFMREKYRRWRRKIRILLLTGIAAGMCCFQRVRRNRTRVACQSW